MRKYKEEIEGREAYFMELEDGRRVRTIEDLVPQGDVTIRKLDRLPANVRDITPEDGKLIVAHSETGHHHMINSTTARLMQGEDPSVCYLSSAEAVELTHCRSWDTHELFVIPAGFWSFTRAREEGPEGWRVVND